MTTSLYSPTPNTGTVSSANSTSLYSNTTSFTTGLVNSSVYSVNGGTGVTVNPTTGNVVVSIGQPVGTTDNVTFNDVTINGNTIFNSFGEALLQYSQGSSIYGTTRTANFQSTTNIGVNASNLTIDSGRVVYNTDLLTTSATTPNQVLGYYDNTIVNTMKGVIEIQSGTDYQALEYLLVQNGTTISLTTYADVRTSSSLTSLTADYNGGTGYLELLVTPVNAVTTYKHSIMYIA